MKLNAHWIPSRLVFTLFSCLLSMVSSPLEASYVDREEVRDFLARLSERHSLDQGKWLALFGKVKQQSQALKAIARPAESKPWHEYRSIFVSESRVNEGVDFWREHDELLLQAESEFGVPAEIIVAIVGVETHYGKYSGRFPALDTLTTLAFDYPPRSGFFKQELEQFLLLVKEEQIDPTSVLGSYAGAMGVPQFISSSYREYAVDFDEDGKRDLWHSKGDVIGSVANYFHRHRWIKGGVVARPASVEGVQYRKLLRDTLKPSLDSSDLAAHGVNVIWAPVNEGPAVLIELKGELGPEFWVGYQNFYVITRYNRSPLYAMAVYQLSERIASRRRALLAQQATAP